jgi:uncharacterized Tic20 family protein
MPLVIPCPSCKAKLKVPETAIGKKVKCPGCQTPITVTDPAAKPAPAPAPAKVKAPAPPPDDNPFDDLHDAPPARKPAAKRRDDDDDEDDRPRPKAKGRPEPEDDEDDRPRPKAKGRPEPEDDEDDRPRPKAKGRPEPEDDEDDRPRSRRRDEDEEEDEDDRPKKKAKSTSGNYSPSESEKSTGMLLWLLALLGVGIVSLIMWIMKRKESRFIDHQGKTMLNLTITNFIELVLCGVIMGVGGYVMTQSVMVGLIIVGLGAAVLGFIYLFTFIIVIIALIKAKNGVWYYPPLCLKLLKA